MRTIVCCLFSISILLPQSSGAQERVSSKAEFVIGQVQRVSGSAEIDLGFVHALKKGDRLALFRSSDIAWNPIGVVKIANPGSSRSTVASVLGPSPKRGDLVVIAQSLLPARPSKKRAEHYVTQRILSRYLQNGYDTTATSTDTRQLASQKDHANRWFRHGSKTGIKLTLGVRREAYDSKRVTRLAKQCRYLGKLRVEDPSLMSSLSARWKMILSTVAPISDKVEPKQTDATSDDGEEFASTVVPNILPRVQQHFKDEPPAVQETTALVLAALLSKSPRSYPAFLQAQYLQTQFPQLGTDEEFVQQLEAFIPSLTGE